jgi:hypothetical protein
VLDDGDTEGLTLLLGLTDDDGETEGLTELDGLTDDEGLTEALGDTEGDTDDDGETDADGDTEAEAELDGLTDAEGLTEGETELDPVCGGTASVQQTHCSVATVNTPGFSLDAFSSRSATVVTAAAVLPEETVRIST